MSEVDISKGAVVCVEAEIKGDVMIGTGTVVHPKAKIIAEAGPIVIGENNLIEEQVVIINKLCPGDKYEDDAEDDESHQAPVHNKQTMTIGKHNVFEVGSYCEALVVGNHNVLETKSWVGKRVNITDGCIIGAKCRVDVNETLTNNTVMYGEKCTRRTQSSHPPAQTLQLDFLTKILPNFHHMMKPTKKT
ncbi:dynactin subunit 6-like [Corticium candelabrum]|uniref:dynactin subunit 6-like n=1 Tax=Corticium candelabrum TaxID=121492 RepID=UPI002E2632FB|nr:dynactin subunit 6-like [Corticium candelabrum]